jgi:hypothetical protein
MPYATIKDCNFSFLKRIAHHSDKLNHGMHFNSRVKWFYEVIFSESTRERRSVIQCDGSIARAAIISNGSTAHNDEKI